jgi:hypothetical protein
VSEEVTWPFGAVTNNYKEKTNMNTYDIRNGDISEIEAIIFGDGTGYDANAIRNDCGSIEFIQEGDNDDLLTIRAKDIPNLILALQKAVSLGWVPAPVVVAAKPVVTKRAVAAKK